jgi:hypothetical protein
VQIGERAHLLMVAWLGDDLLEVDGRQQIWWSERQGSCGCGGGPREALARLEQGWTKRRTSCPRGKRARRAGAGGQDDGVSGGGGRSTAVSGLGGGRPRPYGSAPPPLPPLPLDPP